MREVLACGHYADAIPGPGQMLWLRYPNSALMHEDTAAQIERQSRIGAFKMNGHQGVRVRPVGDCLHEMQWDYDEQFNMPAGYSTRVEP